MKKVDYTGKTVHLLTSHEVISLGLTCKYHAVLIVCENMNRIQFDLIAPIVVNNMPHLIVSVGKEGNYIELAIDLLIVDKSLNMTKFEQDNFSNYNCTISSAKCDETIVWEFLNLFDNSDNLPYLACAIAENSAEEDLILQKVEKLIETIKSEYWINNFL